MTHPNPEIQENQKQLLATLEGEQLNFFTLNLSVGNATYRYHREAESYNPTEEDYEEWLAGLPEVIEKGMRKKGFIECQTVLSFTRYVMEKNDIGLDAYLKKHLEPHEYEFYMKIGDSVKEV